MKTRAMSPEQKTYAAAKAAYEAIKEEKLRRLAGMPFKTHKQIDALVAAEMQVERELGWEAAWDALRQAEEALLQWAYRVAVTHPAYAANIKDLQRVLTCTNVTIRQRAIDFCLRIAA